MKCFIVFQSIYRTETCNIRYEVYEKNGVVEIMHIARNIDDR